MSKPKRRRVGQCVYCGRHSDSLSDDHIPPQNLFPKPRPSNLITVPSCNSCNWGASKDDEHFRLWLVSREDAKGNPARDAIFPAMLRSLRRREARRFSRAFYNNLQSVERFTPAGLYLGSGLLGSLDGRRLDTVAIRITKGLFFHEKGYRLPGDHCVQSVCLGRTDLDKLGREGQQVIEEFILALLQNPGRQIGATFRYWWSQSPNGLDRTIWLFEFYGSLEYYCMTVPLALISPSPNCR